YAYVVKSMGVTFTWTGSLTDDKAGTISASFSLAPGISQTFTASNAITGSVTNTATASGKFNDGSSTSASAQATATAVGHVCTISLVKPATPASGSDAT